MSTNPSPEDAALDAELEVVEALADKAMAAYNHLLSPKQRADMRETLIEVLATHPNASRLIAQLARPPVVDVSGEVGGDGGEAGKDRDAATPGRSGTK